MADDGGIRTHARTHILSRGGQESNSRVLKNKTYSSKCRHNLCIAEILTRALFFLPYSYIHLLGLTCAHTDMTATSSTAVVASLVRFPSIRSRALHIIKYSWRIIYRAFVTQIALALLFGNCVRCGTYKRSGPTLFLVNLRLNNRLRSEAFAFFFYSLCFSFIFALLFALCARQTPVSLHSFSHCLCVCAEIGKRMRNKKKNNERQRTE